MPSITTDNTCICCCPPDGKKCFQEWIANWSCADQAWSGPVTDNRLCLPMGTSTAWAKIAGDAAGCEYRIYVPYDPKHCCSANGDCAGLGDTATPALPFGGAAPPDCCNECYQVWTASWSCADQAWTGPTAGAKVCRPVGTSEAWTKTAGDATGCTYTKLVRIGTRCAADGDCAGADTATPDLPFGGDIPDDCCAADCCDPTTPFSWLVTFSDVENAIFKCLGECGFGNVIGGTGTLGTYRLRQVPLNPCVWVFEGTGPSVIVGGDSPDCSGGGGVVVTGLRVTLEKTGFGFTLRAEILGTGAVTNPFWFNDFSTLPTGDCCTSKSFTNGQTSYSCSEVGINGTAVATPSC